MTDISGVLDYLLLLPGRRKLIQALCEPHRVYHNLQHALEVGAYGDQLPNDERRRFAYLFGLYHDSVYVPRAKDNEEQSAHTFLMDCGISGLLPSTMQDKLVRAIKLSLDHFADEAYTGDPDIDLALDSDLSGLSAPSNIYWRNNAKIKLEYDLPEREWLIGRKAWLERTRGKPIYRVLTRLEAAAKFNLEAELFMVNELLAN